MTTAPLRSGSAGGRLAEIAAGGVVRPLWRRGRFWLALAAMLVFAGLLVAALSPGSGGELDPRSPAKNGSKALARLLHGYGIAVSRTAEVAVAARAGHGDAVLVTSPDDYSPAQLRRIAARAGRLVLLDPAPSVADAAAPIAVRDTVDGVRRPGCSLAGAQAAGPVDLGVAATYGSSAPSAVSCYAGALVIDDRVAVLGSADLLRNDQLTRRGVAALDVNVLSADRTLGRVVWLVPGADAAGPGAPSFWDLFPAWTHRAFVWLIVVGVVLVIWRARRLGPPVLEPLPVMVRAAEAVEGHGRLYRRAHAHARAAAALRAGTVQRLARHTGLPRTATAADVGALVAPLTGRDPSRLHELLAGPAPADDAGLLSLANALQELEAAAGVPPEEKGTR